MKTSKDLTGWIVIGVTLSIIFIAMSISHKSVYGYWWLEDEFYPVTEVTKGDYLDYVIYAREHDYPSFKRERIFCVRTTYKGLSDFIVSDVDSVGQAKCKLEKEILHTYQNRQSMLKKSEGYYELAKENLKKCK